MAYNPDGVSDFEANLDLNDLAYSKFLRKFAGESPALVTKRNIRHSFCTARYESLQGELASSRAGEYFDVWYSFLALRDLHIGLKSRSKLLPSTEVYSPQFVARQFGFTQAVPAPAKFFTANIATYCPPTKSIADANQSSAMGNRLHQFFKLVSFRPNYTGVLGFRYAVNWDIFLKKTFAPVISHAHRKTRHPLTPFPSKTQSEALLSYPDQKKNRKRLVKLRLFPL
uniref:Uncharacterized protein n=1 Tax=Ananas comosus var. bracteatus TaxID=296719 RepID=A0A6V7NZ04_ANACO|nr:unnamed protein product [Ananas comosus var. bracteatus]